jgi:hypothetical protein
MPGNIKEYFKDLYGHRFRNDTMVEIVNGDWDPLENETWNSIVKLPEFKNWLFSYGNEFDKWLFLESDLDFEVNKILINVCW